MKVKFLMLLLLPILSVAQNSYKAGYFISDNGSRTECLIEDLDWKNNPTSFDYKLNPDGERQTGTIKTVKEFSVPQVFKFVKAETDIDRTGGKQFDASKTKAAIFSHETLFLRVLIEGPHTLYHYFDNGLERFFYNDQNNMVKPLVFKYYYPTIESKLSGVFKNYHFRNQLWNDVKCSDTDRKVVEKLEYKKKELVDYFQDVNNCKS